MGRAGFLVSVSLHMRLIRTSEPHLGGRVEAYSDLEGPCILLLWN